MLDSLIYCVAGCVFIDPSITSGCSSASTRTLNFFLYLKVSSWLKSVSVAQWKRRCIAYRHTRLCKRMPSDQRIGKAFPVSWLLFLFVNTPIRFDWAGTCWKCPNWIEWKWQLIKLYYCVCANGYVHDVFPQTVATVEAVASITHTNTHTRKLISTPA